MDPLPETLEAKVLLKVGDNISTDGIMPAGSDILPLRSNIEALSEFAYCKLDDDFSTKCKEVRAAVVVGGENYGQGSSREHAALAPRHLGVRVKIAKSFARIHKANLCNFGIIPLEFTDPTDYDVVQEGRDVRLEGIRERIARGDEKIPLEVGGKTIMTRLDVSARQREYLLAGGALNFVKQGLMK